MFEGESFEREPIEDQTIEEESSGIEEPKKIIGDLRGEVPKGREGNKLRKLIASALLTVSSFGGGQELRASEPSEQEQPRAEKREEKSYAERRAGAVARFKNIEKQLKAEEDNLKFEEDPEKREMIVIKIKALTKEREDAYERLDTGVQYRIRGEFDIDYDIQKANLDFEKIIPVYETLLKDDFLNGEDVLIKAMKDMEFLLQKKDLPVLLKERLQEARVDAIRKVIRSRQVNAILLGAAKTKRDKEVMREFIEHRSHRDVVKFNHLLSEIRKNGWKIPQELKESKEKKRLEKK